jgi:hypothetical protein
MKGFWWKLPWLRALSPMGRGFLVAGIGVGVGAAPTALVVSVAGRAPAGSTYGVLAEVGGTLLVAYAVTTGWVLQASMRRDRDRENWVGFVAGLGLCALVGIAAAMALSGHDGRLEGLEMLAFAWSVFSILMLGAFTAAQPWLLYHWTHAFNAEYPDE